jgi:hypothetical protein
MEAVEVDAVAVIGIMFVLVTGLVGVIYKNSAKRLDLHGQKIDGMTEQLIAMNGSVTRHEEQLRNGDNQFTMLLSSIEALRRLSFAQLDDLNERRAARGLPALEMS